MLLWGCLELVILRVVLLHLLDFLLRSIMTALCSNVHLRRLMVVVAGRWHVRVHDRTSIYDELGMCFIRFDLHGLGELLHLENTLLVGLDAILEGSERV